MSNVNVMNKVREQMQNLKDKIDEAENREFNAREAIKDKTATVDSLEQDRDSKKNKIALTEEALAERTEKLERKVERLKELEQKHEQESEMVKELETLEIDGDERLEDLEKEMKKTNEHVENRELELSEMRQRAAQLESELEKAYDKEDKASSKLETLKANVIQARKRLDSLKEREEGSYEREDESGNKHTFLTQELHTKLTEAEENERAVVKLEKYKDKLEGEIEDWQNRIKDVHDEFSKLETELI